MAFPSRNRTRSIRIEGTPYELVNDAMADGLSDKVSKLKNLAIDIDRESLFLDHGLADSMEAGQSRMGRTVNRVRMMGRGTWNSGRRFVFLVAGMTFTMLLILYVVTRFSYS